LKRAGPALGTAFPLQARHLKSPPKTPLRDAGSPTEPAASPWVSPTKPGVGLQHRSGANAVPHALSFDTSAAASHSLRRWEGLVVATWVWAATSRALSSRTPSTAAGSFGAVGGWEYQTSERVASSTVLAPLCRGPLSEGPPPPLRTRHSPFRWSIVRPTHRTGSGQPMGRVALQSRSTRSGPPGRPSDRRCGERNVQLFPSNNEERGTTNAFSFLLGPQFPHGFLMVLSYLRDRTQH
jgi:hypothetical protein